MAFTSFGFIIFVSAAGLLYYLLPKRFQWTVLLLASYAFYAIANPKGLLYIGGTTFYPQIDGYSKKICGILKEGGYLDSKKADEKNEKEKER